MDQIPWYGVLGIIGALAWAAMVIIGALRYGSAKRRQPATELVARLDSIDSRLAAVEKTLNDIP
jgi:hypothetical protein